MRLKFLAPFLVLLVVLGRASPQASANTGLEIVALSADCSGHGTLVVSSPKEGAVLTLFVQFEDLSQGSFTAITLNATDTVYGFFIEVPMNGLPFRIAVVGFNLRSDWLKCGAPPTMTPVPPTNTPVPPTMTPVPPTVTATPPVGETKTPVIPTQPPRATDTPVQPTATRPPGEVVVQLPDTGAKPTNGSTTQYLLGIVAILVLFVAGIMHSWRRGRVRS